MRLISLAPGNPALDGREALLRIAPGRHADHQPGRQALQESLVGGEIGAGVDYGVVS